MREMALILEAPASTSQIRRQKQCWNDAPQQTAACFEPTSHGKGPQDWLPRHRCYEDVACSAARDLEKGQRELKSQPNPELRASTS
jgi:hypothetical protein